MLSFSVMFAVLMPMFDSQVSIARAYPAAPRTDAVVQPPCGEAEFNTAFNIVNSGGGTLTFNCGITTIFLPAKKSSQPTLRSMVTTGLCLTAITARACFQ